MRGVKWLYIPVTKKTVDRIAEWGLFPFIKSGEKRPKDCYDKAINDVFDSFSKFIEMEMSRNKK